MPCPVCGFTNPQGTAACSACGTQLIAPPKALARAGDAICKTHPDTPALQTCNRCGTFYCGACLERGLDGQFYCVECRSRSALPWDDREKLGLLRAWWQTSTKLLLEPMKTLAGTPRDAPVGSSLLFSLIAAVSGFLTTVALYGVFFGIGMVAAISKNDELSGNAPKLGLGAMGVGVGMIVYILFAIGMQVVMVLVLSGIEHLVLQLSGEKQLGPWTATLRAHVLGQAPYVLGLVPVCGLWVMGIWSIVLRCMTLMHLQRVSAGKAVIAVLAPVFLLCGCGAAAYFVAIAAVIGAAGLAR